MFFVVATAVGIQQQDAKHAQTSTHAPAKISLVAVTNRGSLGSWLLLYRGCLAFGGRGGTSELTASRNN